MIYIFKNAFTLSDGSIIKKGDAVFLDDPNEASEVAKAVEADKVEPKAKKQKENI